MRPAMPLAEVFDRHANFCDTFGQSLEHFELEVLAHLKSIVR